MTAGIGHNAQVVSVNSLSQADKEFLKGVVKELDDSLTRIAAERDLQKEAIEEHNKQNDAEIAKKNGEIVESTEQRPPTSVLRQCTCGLN